MFKIGCHSLTWGNYHKDSDYSIDSVCAQVKEAGFSGIELFEPVTKLESPESLKKLLNMHGLELATLSGNLNLDSPDNKDMDEAKEKLSFLNSMGLHTFMLCGAWIKDPAEKSDENFNRFAVRLEELSSFAAGLDINVAFHPHIGTLAETKDDIDKLFKDIKVAKLCIDTAHITAAGSDPIEVIKEHKDRLELVHLKDYDTTRKVFVELGEGIVTPHFRDIISEIESCGYSGWFVCELDETSRTPQESVKMNREFLKGLGL